MKVHYVSTMARLNRLHRKLCEENDLDAVDFIQITSAEYRSMMAQLMLPYSPPEDLRVYGFRVVVKD